MKLVAFSVSNYRSITTAYKLPVRQMTVIIGPNNEGKSNILRALGTALEVLSSIGGYRMTKGRLRFRGRPADLYDWESDFPFSLQQKQPDGESVFTFEFLLSEDEIEEFHSEVKSNLNGTLPIELSIGRGEPGFRVLKKGPGAAALSKKAESIAQFVARRININYIPAIRTAESAHEIVGGMVDKALTVIESDRAYQDALAAIAKIQQPVLDTISGTIKETLQQFLQNVRDVKVTIAPEARYRALRRSYDIIVDDGTPTLLARKGDGVQSLSALSLMRHVSETGASGRQLILAIEEPESHLHPSAIHQLKGVLGEIAIKHQVIMTTHCPLFVDRNSIKSNILVNKRKAVPARDVKQIRDILGVRAADNLQHAELILIVEGEEDNRSLSTLLRHNSAVLRTALTQGTLALDSLLGGSNLSYKLTQTRESLCLAHSFLDNDKCGLEAAERAERDGLMTMADVTFSICDGQQESEIEDMYAESVYAPMLLNKYGVSTQSPKFKGKAKWSERLRAAFRHQGKTWNESIEARVKRDVSELVEASPAVALNAHHRSAFDALVKALESKLSNVAEGKVHS